MRRSSKRIQHNMSNISEESDTDSGSVVDVPIDKNYSCECGAIVGEEFKGLPCTMCNKLVTLRYRNSVTGDLVKRKDITDETLISDNNCEVSEGQPMQSTTAKQQKTDGITVNINNPNGSTSTASIHTGFIVGSICVCATILAAVWYLKR